MKQMRGRVVAHGGLANFGVDDRVYFHSDMNWLAGFDLMCAYALHRRVAAVDVSDNGVVLIVVEHAHITDLPAGIGVERRVIEHNFAFFARAKLADASAVMNDGK